jgi:hypothetical protein
VSRASEREAREKANEILRRAGKQGRDFVDGDGDTSYGAGKLTKAQRKSQERHIPLTPAPQTVKGKIWRNLTGF